MADNQTPNKQKILPHILAAGGAVLLTALIVFFIWQGAQAKNGALPAGGMQIQKDAVDYSQSIPDGTQSTGAQAGIKIPGYPEVTVGAGDMAIPLTLMNPEGNPCYFSIAVLLDDSDTVLYQSQLIEPGKAIKGFQADRTLAPGDHKLTLQISTYSLTDKTQMNGAKTSTTLHVLEQ